VDFKADWKEAMGSQRPLGCILMAAGLGCALIAGAFVLGLLGLK
jgi:hypothetical protein